MRTRQVFNLVPVLDKWNGCAHCGESFAQPWSAMVFLQYGCKSLHVSRTRVWQLRAAGGRGAVSTGMELWNGSWSSNFRGRGVATVHEAGLLIIINNVDTDNIHIYTAYGKKIFAWLYQQSFHWITPNFNACDSRCDLTCNIRLAHKTRSSLSLHIPSLLD